ncbi:MAG: orotate phosphoribosyltransferase [Candidatus Melainabacteria bacterium]|nr:orotate phosphoribosyltransferase [Candidatus Melainabacteria bacterium]
MTCSTRETDKLVGDILKAVGAWQEGHFLLTSGMHSEEYMQCQKVLQYPRLGNFLADLLIARVIEAGIHPEVVVGPAMGAIHWEVFVAQALERHNLKESGIISNYFLDADTICDALPGDLAAGMTRAVFAEKIVGQNNFEIRRGIDLAPGQKVLVVEDVTTTGGSSRRVLELLNEMGCEPVAVAALVDRSGSRITYDTPFIKLLTLDLATYDKKECPMCKAGGTAIKPGSTAR